MRPIGLSSSSHLLRLLLSSGIHPVAICCCVSDINTQKKERKKEIEEGREKEGI